MPTLAELRNQKAKLAPAAPTPAPPDPAAPITLAQLRSGVKPMAPTPAVADVTRDPRQDAQPPTQNILRRTPFDETTPLTFFPELGGNFLKGIAQQGIGLSEFGGIVLKEAATPLIAAAGDVAQAVTDPAAARGSMAEHALQGLGHAVSLSGKIAATPQKVRGLIDQAAGAIEQTAATDPAKLATAPLAFAYENPYEVAPLPSMALRAGAKAALPAATKAARGAILRGGGPGTGTLIGLEGAAKLVSEKGPYEALRLGMRDKLLLRGKLESHQFGQRARELVAEKRGQYAANVNRVTQEIAKKMDLPEQELAEFSDYVTGIREVPSTASPKLREALDWYRNQSEQWRNDAIKYGVVTADDAESRAFQPLRNKAFNEGKAAYLNGDPMPIGELEGAGYRAADEFVRDFVKQGGKIKEAESEIAQEIATRKVLGTLPEQATKGRIKEYNDVIAGKLAAQGRDAPVYFPNMRSAEQRAEAVGPSMRQDQRYKPAFGKHSTGRTLALDAVEKNPRVVVDRSNRARERFKMHEDILRDIEGDAVKARKRLQPPPPGSPQLIGIAKSRLAEGKSALEPELQAMRSAERAGVPIDKAITQERRAAAQAELTPSTVTRGPKYGARILAAGEEALPDEMLFVPAGFRQMYRKSIDMTDEIVRGLTDGLGMDEAFARAMASQMNTIQDGGMAFRSPKRYAIPRSVGERLQREFSVANPGMRVFFDKPVEYWRTAVLAMRPAWFVNNTTSNALLTLLQGVAPESYIKALQEAYHAKMPNEIGSGMGFGPIEGAAHSLDDIIRHSSGATQTMASIYKRTESLPIVSHIGKGADHVRAFNGAIEDYFRRASYIHESAKFARKNYVQRTGDRFFKLYDELQEFDRLKPDQIKKAVQETNFWLNDYMNGLHPWERATMRRLIPFWSFYRFQARLALQLPSSHPGRAAMIQLLARAGQEAAEDNEAPPAFMQGQGVVDTGSEVEVGGKRLRVFMGTSGWNPFIIGQGPQSLGVGEGQQVFNTMDMVNAMASQGGPFVQLVKTAMTQKDAFGREYTHPYIVQGPDGTHARIDPATNKVIPPSKSGPVDKPMPGPVEFATNQFPQARLGRAVQSTLFGRGPNAPTPNWTASPFATQPSKDQKSVIQTRALDDIIAYFTGARLILVDVERARRGEARGMVLDHRGGTKRQVRGLMRSGARRGVLLRSAERDTTQ